MSQDGKTRVGNSSAYVPDASEYETWLKNAVAESK